MPTMFDPNDRAAMLARLRRLGPQSERRWGKMTAPQMVWHLGAQLRHCLGEIDVAPRGNALLHSALFKWLVIDSPMPWPKGKLPTSPEYVAFDTGAWAADVAKLTGLLERWTTRGEANAAVVHPAFGALTGSQVGRLVWRHWDHHLKQFGA